MKELFPKIRSNYARRQRKNLIREMSMACRCLFRQVCPARKSLQSRRFSSWPPALGSPAADNCHLLVAAGSAYKNDILISIVDLVFQLNLLSSWERFGDHPTGCLSFGLTDCSLSWREFSRNSGTATSLCYLCRSSCWTPQLLQLYLMPLSDRTNRQPNGSHFRRRREKARLLLLSSSCLASGGFV